MKRVKIISALIMLAAFVLISPYSSTSAHLELDLCSLSVEQIKR